MIYKDIKGKWHFSDKHNRFTESPVFCKSEVATAEMNPNGSMASEDLRKEKVEAKKSKFKLKLGTGREKKKDKKKSGGGGILGFLSKKTL